VNRPAAAYPVGMGYGEDTPRWHGVNHLALVTPDMDATVRFYHGVLGMRLVATLMAGPIRHYFFEIAPGNTVAFFEWKGAPTLAKQAGVPTAVPTQLDHLAFDVPHESTLVELRRRLEEAGCGVTEVIDHGIMRSVYFTDPNGIALEASWWAVDVTSRPSDYGDKQVFSDPDPVPAVHELADTGALSWTPRTELVGDDVVDPA
jgi:catechol 2,3-dioxygenase-like lactoylglutathione lyase family enzyme